MKNRITIMMGNKWSAVCELFANGAFGADRQLKARHNEIPGVLCDDEQPKGGIR